MLTEALADASADLENWPGRRTREPGMRDYGWLPLRALAAQMREALARHFAGRADLAVLDLGCDHKPYFPLFQPYARRYVGLDVGKTTKEVDVVGGASAPPFRAGKFDAVLCSQVLEHVPDPMATLKEIARVLKPGGRVLLSTHGTFIYHPHPTDFWRWTHDGLAHLFRTNAEWTSVTVRPGAGTAATVAMLVAHTIDLLCKRARMRVLGAARASGRVTSVAEREDRAGSHVLDGRRREDLGDKSHSPVDADRFAVRDCDSRRFLASMLQREQPEVGQVGDIDSPRCADPENPAHS